MKVTMEGVHEALVELRATLEAAVGEVHVDVSAFKQRVEQRIDELRLSNRPLAEAVSRLQEDNLQLRAKLEALSRLVERLTGLQRSTEEEGTEDPDQTGVVDCVGSENSQSTSTQSERSRAAPSSSPAPWRLRRAAETNVSI